MFQLIEFTTYFVYTIFFIILIFIFYSYYYYYYKYWYRKLLLSKEFVGPPALPIIGNGLTFINVNSDDILPIILNYVTKYGERFKIWLGPEFNIHTINIKDAEEILSNSKYNEKADEYNLLRPWLRDGLLISKKQKWFKRRKIITPAFHFQILEQFIEIFYNQSLTLIENISQIENKNRCDLYPLITLYTLDVICETAMGVKINAQKNSQSEYVQAVQAIASVVYQRMSNAVYKYDFIFYLTSLARLQKHALKILHEFSEKVIIARREEILKNQEENQSNNNNNNNVKRKMAFLDILLQSEIDNEPLTNLDIREEVDTFMFEGHDTTASAIHFMLYFLACYPEKQQKCFNEICEVFQLNDNNKNNENENEMITYQKLNILRYMELCIKETLRLCPSVPIFGRKIDKESTINGNRYPAGTNIGINTFIMNRLEYLFPNPYEFIPERFENDLNMIKLNSYTYIPFSAGPRNCIGQKFALLEIKSVITKILYNYELEYVGDCNGPKFTFELILRCSNILWFKLKPRIHKYNS